MTEPKKDASNSPNFPLAGLARDGWSTADRATATCYCGSVQLSFVSNVYQRHLLFPKTTTGRAQTNEVTG